MSSRAPEQERQRGGCLRAAARFPDPDADGAAAHGRPGGKGGDEFRNDGGPFRGKEGVRVVRPFEGKPCEKGEDRLPRGFPALPQGGSRDGGDAELLKPHAGADNPGHPFEPLSGGKRLRGHRLQTLQDGARPFAYERGKIASGNGGADLRERVLFLVVVMMVVVAVGMMSAAVALVIMIVMVITVMVMSVAMIVPAFAAMPFALRVVAVRGSLVNGEADPLAHPLEMHVKIADRQLGELPLQRGRAQAEGAERADHPVAADAGVRINMKSQGHEDRFNLSGW